MKQRVLMVFVIVPLIFLVHWAFAGMSSTNYNLESSVVSGGGGPMGSANYNVDATVGQSSPLMDQASPPQSTNYDNFPGFWYTTGVACILISDLTGDGVVNIFDYAAFRSCYATPGDLTCDLTDDGMVNIFDYAAFRAHYYDVCP